MRLSNTPCDMLFRDYIAFQLCKGRKNMKLKLSSGRAEINVIRERYEEDFVFEIARLKKLYPEANIPACPAYKRQQYPLTYEKRLGKIRYPNTYRLDIASQK